MNVNDGTVPCPTCGDAVMGSTLKAVLPLRARINDLEAELEDTKLALAVHQAEVARLLVILREAEWGGSTGIDYEIEAPACPVCGGLRNEQKFNAWGKLVGHRPGCSYLGLVSTSARPGGEGA